MQLQRREKQFDVRPGLECSDRLSDVVEVLPNKAPVGDHQDDDGKASRFKAVLVTKILVRRDECRKALGFGGAQELAVLQRLPAALERRDDVVIR